MNKLVKFTFENRGYSQDFIDDLQCSSSEQLAHVSQMAEMLHHAKNNDEAICIRTDFDTDGICSGLIAYTGLSELGFKVTLYRSEPNLGYEITREDVNRILELYPKTKILLTCDVGITCIDAINYAKQLGLKVIVTDHHQECQTKCPADVVVDPMQEEDEYKHPQICGAFVIYKCLEFYAKQYGTEFDLNQIERLQVFAGIGTVADLMPILYENRNVVKNAIGILKMIYCGKDDYMVNALPGCEIYRKTFFGLHCLMKEFSANKQLATPSIIDEKFFGYVVAPAINTIKRMQDVVDEVSINIIYDCFLDEQQENAKKLLELCSLRKEKLEEFYEQVQQEQNFAPYIYLSDAPKGFLGLLANKLAKENQSPVIVVHKSDDGRIQGSARGLKWYPFLTKMRANGVKADGHEFAFGVAFDDLSEVEKLHKLLEIDVPKVYEDALQSGDEIQENYDFTIAQDGSGDTTIDFQLFDEYLEEIMLYKPFGVGFPEPNILFTSDAELKDEQIRVMGSEKQHLALTFDYGFQVILWNQADDIDKIKAAKKLKFAGFLQKSEFMGKEQTNLIGRFVEDVER